MLPPLSTLVSRVPLQVELELELELAACCRYRQLAVCHLYGRLIIWSQFPDVDSFPLFNDRVEYKTEWQQQRRAEYPDKVLPFAVCLRKIMCLYIDYLYTRYRGTRRE